MWQSQPESLFDILLCVIDTDARSYLSHSPQSILVSAENRKYSLACGDHRVSFTPLCFSGMVSVAQRQEVI